MKYLALGDSYTIGELVAAKDNFPNQLAGILKKTFDDLEPPKIIATTGWTSEELYRAVENERPENDFDLVTLLIGVNDQYRGLALEQYERYFLKLLMRAILSARGQSRRVFVLSIPDWGVTPFAKSEAKDTAGIASEIDAFNKKNKLMTLAYRCHYIDITSMSRTQGLDSGSLAEDLLHYSGKAYGEWANSAARIIDHVLKNL
ncbi:MAG TPA: GDSL-type esterase/lipase family protein [Edaphocola sp.]|nr:GDSL-type esterase/lipase family protein [Edaphocola sp.]